MERHRKLPVYVPGDHVEGGSLIRLNTNESPYPPSPGVAAAIAAEVNSLGYYNDPDCTQLRQALAGVYGVKPSQVIAVNGSDELLYFAFIAFADENHPIALPDVTYGYYDLFAAAQGIPLVKIPLKEDFTIDYHDYLSIGKTIVFPNPNAPTGFALPLDQIAEIADSNPENVVIVDEAYVDFGGKTALELIEKYDNLIIVQTFSKARSMAGMRIGYAISNPQLIKYLNDAKYAFNSYTMNQAAIIAGVEAVKDKDYFEAQLEKIVATREWTKKELSSLGFQFPDSKSNFILAKHPDYAGKDLFEALKKEGIYVRFLGGERIKDYLRISIGTMEEMQSFINFLKKYMESHKEKSLT